ncbi:ArsR family transcriptional regulator [Natrarchaeobius halalkaliphilus]|uniref:ArsR family transcriptional regulator n=1 Tax=Natrarchaeobius halalkaliphilus TaxID=1679091 RepID=A0A3N6M7S2_9EURY|nr:ArsR family transcriptional regulator [Natrarchaeobius halalkaliphilus]RQG91391.1 ArsR family transcriptional regulator [Natrarchaeobius halalkaliphilus]
MSSDVTPGSSAGRSLLNDVPVDHYEILRHPRRVRLLEIIEDRPRVTLEELTTTLIERGGTDVPVGTARREVHLSLVHNHLPRLVDAGIVEWDDERGVALVENPPVCPERLSRVLKNDTQRLECLTDPVRLRLLDVLNGHAGSLSLEALASTLAANGIIERSDADTVTAALHHSHLPALDDAGLLEYDPESGLVRSIES